MSPQRGFDSGRLAFACLQFAPARLVGGQVVVMDTAQQGDLMEPVGQPGEQLAHPYARDGGGNGGEGASHLGGGIRLGVPCVELGWAADEIDPDAGCSLLSVSCRQFAGEACQATGGHSADKGPAVQGRSCGVFRACHGASLAMPKHRAGPEKGPTEGNSMIDQGPDFNKWNPTRLRRWFGTIFPANRGRIEGPRPPVGATWSRREGLGPQCGMIG